MIELVLASSALALFSAFMFFVLAVGRKFLVEQNFTYIYLVNLVFFFAFYKVIAYYVVPILLGLLSNFRYLREDGVELLSLVNIYGIEALSWIAWVAGLIVVAVQFKRRGDSNDYGLFKKNEDERVKWILLLLSIAFVYLQVTTILGIYISSAYPWFLEITKSILIYTGSPASLLLTFFGFKRWGLSFGILGLLLFVIGLATISTRGALVYSVLFLVYLLLNFSKSRRIKSQLAFGFLSVFILYSLLGGIPFGAFNIENNVISSVEINIDNKRGDRTAFEEIEWRYGALSRMSTKFVDMYDRGDSAGINPIRNSFLGFLPRSLNPDKPYPSTVDGNDYYSQGMYLLYREIYGYDTYSMVEFSSGGHAYWEFGWFGVLVLSAISGVYIGLCMYYSQKLGLLSIILMMATFKPWGYVDPKIWASEIVLQFYQLIIPLILIIVLYKCAAYVRRFFLRIL